MRCWLAGLLIFLLVTVAGAESPLPAADRPAAADLARTLALFAQVDPQTLPADRRQSLYLAVVDALLSDGQQARALAVLNDFHQSVPSTTEVDSEAPIRSRLQRIDSPVLAAALPSGMPLTVLIAAELAGRGEPVPADLQKEWLIGVMLPLTGRFAPFGQEVRQGLELARTALATPRPVRFVYHDTAAENIDSAALVGEMAAQAELLAVIGPLLSSEAAPAALRAEQARVPLLLLAAREGATGGYVFRQALTIAAQVRELAAYASNERLLHFAVLHPATRQGELSAELFKTAVENLGGVVVARQSYPAGAVDLRQPLQALAAEARRNGGRLPDALFLPDDARQVAQVIPQLGFSRLDLVQLLGTNAWNDPDLVRLAGPQIEGAIFVDGFFSDSPRGEVRDFVALFRTAYGTAPTLLAAQGYDAARILLTLLARSATTDRETLRQSLAVLRDFPGVTGRTRFSAQGEAEKSLFLLQVQDGLVVQINP